MTTPATPSTTTGTTNCGDLCVSATGFDGVTRVAHRQDCPFAPTPSAASAEGTTDAAYLRGLAEDEGESVCECGVIHRIALGDPGRLHAIADRLDAAYAAAADARQESITLRLELIRKLCAVGRTSEVAK